jgi:hypothetical protein
VNVAAQPLSFEAIIMSTSRVPYSHRDMQAITDHFRRCRTNGLDLFLEGSPSDEQVTEIVLDGLLPLQSRDLETDFLFVNVNAGRGIFGGQKTRIATFTSDIYRGEYFPGPVLGGIVRALVGINNLYRGAGLLKGGAY